MNKRRFFLILLFFILPSSADARISLDDKFVYEGYRRFSKDKIEAYSFLLSGNNAVELGPYRNPSFSEDGRRIAAVTIEHPINEIVILDGAGTVLVRTSVKGYAGRPRFSPDGSKVYYQLKTKNGRTLLARYDIVSGTHFLVVNPEAGLDVIGYDISSDNRILYVLGGHYGRRHGGQGVFVTNPATGSTRIVVKNGVQALWFPGGKEIVYLTRFDEKGKAVGGKYGSIFSMNLSDGAARKVEDAHTMFLKSPLKLSKDGLFFYTALPCGKFGQHLVRWPVGSPEKTEDITPCAGPGEIPATHTHPDWHQSSDSDQ